MAAPEWTIRAVTTLAACSLTSVLVGWKLYRRAFPVATAQKILQRYGKELKGRSILISGACGGLGLEILQCVLAEHCGVLKVWVHGRTLEKVQAIIRSLPVAQQHLCIPAVADFGNLREVRDLSDRLKGTPPDLVLCCAGVATLPSRTESSDGYEMQFAVNHLAHFALLSPLALLMARSNARVVLVSSDIHRTGMAALNLEDLNSETRYSWFGAYLASKSCNVLFARSLAARGICAVSCTPGSTATDIDRYLTPVLRFGFRYLGPGLMAKTVAEGASTLAYCLAGEVQSGGFYADGGVPKEVGGSGEEELWEASTALVNKALANNPAS